MANIIKPPTRITKDSIDKRTSLALLGSIEQGIASEWQKTAEEFFKDYDFDIYNPRREHWDASWKQSMDNPQFVEQVEWELTALENVAVKLFYFDPATKSPITLIELGLSVGVGRVDIVVCCPEGFWRKGNVDIICRRYGIHREPTLEAALYDVRSKLNAYHGIPAQLKLVAQPEAELPLPFVEL